MLPLKDILYVGAFIALLVAFGVYTHREREIGRQQIEAQDAAAKALLDAQVKADEAVLQDIANRAAQERKHAEATLEAYMSDHPVRPLRVCYANTGGSGLSQTPQGGGSPQSSGAGPASLPEVSQRDVSGDLDTIVRAASELALLYRESRAVSANP